MFPSELLSCLLSRFSEKESYTLNPPSPTLPHKGGRRRKSARWSTSPWPGLTRPSMMNRQSREPYDPPLR